MNKIETDSSRKFKRGIWVSLAMSLTLPPLLGLVVMVFLGVYPLKEGFSILYQYGAIYISAVAFVAYRVVARLINKVVDLQESKTGFGESEITGIKRLPLIFLITTFLYFCGGVVSANLSLSHFSGIDTNANFYLHSFVAMLPAAFITLMIIFFHITDVLGEYIAANGIRSAAIPIWLKMTVLGLFVPVLIDTTLIVYYYDRTSYFTFETFLLWGVLLLVASFGTWLAVRSFQRSISPLYTPLQSSTSSSNNLYEDIIPCSLDEIGVLASGWKELLLNNQESEKRLIQSEKRFRDLVEQSSDWIWEVNTDVVLSYVSPKIKDILGYEPDEVVGKSAFELMSKEEAERVADVYKKLIADRQPFEGMVNLNQHKDGRSVLLESSGIPVFDAEGNWCGYRGIDRDIGERHHYELELQQERNFINAIIENAGALIVVLDRQGRIQRFNNACEEVTYYSSDEVIGRHVWDLLLLSEEVEQVKNVFSQLEFKKLPNKYTNYWLAKDKSKRLIEWSNVVMLDEQGDFEYVISIGIDITEKSKAQAQLAERSELLERVFENTHTLIAYLDTGFNFIRVNQAYLDVDNRKEEELIGKNHFEFYPNDDNKKIFQKVVATGEPHFSHAKPFEYELNPDRGITHWNWSLQPIKENGAVIALLLVLVNVTDQIKAQESLIRNEEALNSAQAISHFGSWDWDILTGQLTWTDEIYRIFGLQPQAFSATYEAFVETIHPDDRDMVTTAVSNSIESTEIPYDLSHRIIRPDGDLRYVREKGVIYRDENDRPIRMLGVVHDITETKLAEEALRESEQNFRSTFEQAAVGVAHVAPDGTWLKVNQKLCDIVGYDEAELLSKTFQDITHKDDLDKDLEYVNQLLHGDLNTYSMEKRYIRKNGNIIWVNLTVSLVRTLDGTPRYFISVIEDINARKLAEEKVVELNRQLKQRVSEREMELSESLELVKKENAERRLAEEGLRKAVNEADYANKLKSAFLGRMSHELRTPMNAILGFGQLMGEEVLSSDQKSFMDEIMQASYHLMDLIDEVLDLSRIETGNINIKLEPVSVYEVVQESTALMSIMAEERSITIDNQVHDESLMMQADRVRTKEVIVNLLSNAIKYSQPGGRVWLTATVPHDHLLRLEIKDTAKGLDEEQQGLIFEPFNRLGAEYSDIEGTGIGLTISKQLMELMGGEIGVTSEINKGSTFWIELPQAAETALATDYDTQQNETNNSDADKTILYVEDNPANLRLVENVIRKQPSWHLISATTAELGISLARENLPDLIILDLNLPGMDGYEALSRLRNFHETRAIPVIALSAAAMPRDVERGLLAGFKRYVTKPIAIDALREVLHTELADKSGDTRSRIEL